jgi:hypothetical protein
VADKYMTLARDAQSSGDTVAAENYLQHAEHYNRIVMAAQAQFQQQQPQFREGGSEEGYDDDRQMNGRSRDRFEFNGGDGRNDEDGDDRFEGDGEDDRFRQPMQQGRQQDHDNRPRGPRPDRFDRPRHDRQDYRDRNDRRDDRDGGHRQERYQRAEAPQPEVPAPVEAAAAAQEEPSSQPRRRRGRPPRGENDQNTSDGDSTSDGAAALAAFPD